MNPEDVQNWADALTDEQRQQLRWLQDHRCLVEATYAPPDPLHDLPGELLLEVKVDRHAVTKIRGSDVRQMFAFLYHAARGLFEYVSQQDGGWTGVQPASGDEENASS